MLIGPNGYLKKKKVMLSPRIDLISLKAKLRILKEGLKYIPKRVWRSQKTEKVRRSILGRSRRRTKFCTPRSQKLIVEREREGKR